MAKKKPPKYLQCPNSGLEEEYDGGSGMYFTKNGLHLGSSIPCQKCGSTETDFPRWQFENR
jgi:hypothetical protein